MDNAKIYNVCLQRVKFQVGNAKQRLNNCIPHDRRMVLESYNTGDIEEIVDILELYDLDDRSLKGLTEKLQDLAYTVSILVKDTITFEYDARGNLGLYLTLKQEIGDVLSETQTVLVTAS